MGQPVGGPIRRWLHGEGVRRLRVMALFKRVRLQPVIMRDTNGKRRWPGSGWLVPVARSGYSTKNTRTRFLCPDDTDSAQGVAGRAWAGLAAVEATQLPDVTDPNCSEADLRSYAEATSAPTRRC